MIWWSIPILATLAAWLWTRFGARNRTAVRNRPEPGSPQDAAELARLSDALDRPLPGRGDPTRTGAPASGRSARKPTP